MENSDSSGQPPLVEVDVASLKGDGEKKGKEERRERSARPSRSVFPGFSLLNRTDLTDVSR